MRIANNIMALNAHRQLVINQGGAAKSIEKLSSGFRINRAGDDAAGLAISEKMRGQIRGLNQAIRNAQDAISLIQTAEGALTETHAILQRMRELAVQSASDTNTEVDRNEIQKEIDQLAVELTRIANTTEFNTKTLLDGTFQGTFHIGANRDQNLTLAINDMSAEALGVAGEASATMLVNADEVSADFTNSLGNLDSYLSVGANVLDVVELDGTNVSSVGGGGVNANYGLANANGEIVAISEDGVNYFFLDDAYQADNLAEAGEAEDDSGGAIAPLDFGHRVISGTITITVDDGANGTINASGTASFQLAANTTLGGGTYVVRQVDDGSGPFLELVNAAGDVVARTDGVDNKMFLANGVAVLTSTADFEPGDEITMERAGGIDVSSQEAANNAIEIINHAIEAVSAERSKLGALQNRLEHTIANLGASAENLQAAESRIRDVDMAKEMMEFTKYQILQQASTAMLAQANLAPQSVLQLLG